MSTSNHILSDMVDIIRIRIRIRPKIWKQIWYQWYPSVSDPFSSLGGWLPCISDWSPSRIGLSDTTAIVWFLFLFSQTIESVFGYSLFWHEHSSGTMRALVLQCGNQARQKWEKIYIWRAILMWLFCIVSDRPSAYYSQPSNRYVQVRLKLDNQSCP